MQVAGIKEIYTAQDLDHFFEIPKKIYKNRSEVVPEDFGLLKELFLNILNNENGLKELRLWVMVGYGRIAVVFDKQTRQGWFGYFDVKAPGTGSAVLLHQAEDFLMQRGAVSITGPVSFAERDRHWGMMQNGQVRHAWGENFHVPGLCDQMPSLGYSSAFKQYTYAVPSGLLQLSWLIPMAERARNRYQLSIISLKTTSPELIKHYFMQVYNEAWPWAEPLTIERTHKLFNEIKPVLIAELVQIVMIGERPVAVFAAIVEPGGYFKGNKPALLSKFQFLFNSWLGRHKHLRGMMFGVVPDFQKKGLEAFMVTHIQRVMMLDYPDAEMELSWVGSFNPTMMKMVEKFGAFVVKTHVVWTKKLS